MQRMAATDAEKMADEPGVQSVGRTVRKKRHARLRELERLAAETIAFTAPLPADSDAELAHAPDPGYGAPDLPPGLRRSEAKPAAALHDDLSDAAPRKKRQKAQAAVPSPVPEELTAPDQESQRPRAAAVQKSARKRKNKFKQEPGGGASPAQTVALEPPAPKGSPKAAKGFEPRQPTEATMHDKTRQGQPSAAKAQTKSRAASTALGKMRSQLHGGRFRMLNEQLYTSDGASAYALMQENPALFDAYHEGFRTQTEGWHTNPVDLAIAWLRAKSGKVRVVADLGCGDAKIGQELARTHTVHSFDLVSRNERVVACNIASVPLETGSCDAAVFALALMGHDYPSFLAEASRVIASSGFLWIAEVRSRFVPAGAAKEDFSQFLECLEQLGFRVVKQDVSNKMFVVWVLQKAAPAQCSFDGLKWPALAPCIYKRR